MIEYSPQLDRQYGAEVVYLLRSWQDREDKRKRGRIEIVDFDLAGDVDPLIPDEDISRPAAIPTRARMLFTLSQIREHFDPESLDGQFMRSRIKSHIALVNAAEQRQSYSLGEYLEETLGLVEGSEVNFGLVPEEDINSQRQIVANFFSDLGFDFTRWGWNKFFQELSLDPTQIQEKYLQAERVLVPIMQEVLGVDIKPEYHVDFVDEKDASWINWTKGDSTGFQLRINTHPNTRMRWFEGVPERLVAHEVLAHMFEGYSWRDNIKKGLINPGYGITSVPGPEQWHCEGFGNTVPYFIPEIYNALSPVGKFATELRLLETWVMRNAQILTDQNIGNIPEYAGYALDLLPNFTEENVTRDLELRISNPSERAYKAAYGGSFEHVKYARRLASANPVLDKRLELVKFFLTQPATPLQIAHKVAELEKEKLSRDKRGKFWIPRNWLERARSVVI